MTKVVLSDLTNLQNETTAVSTINANRDLIENGFDNTLSRDGTSPNEMHASIDFNGYPLLNIPAPSASTDAVRLSDLNAIVAATGNMPAGGTINQVLTKNSSTNYDTSWSTPSTTATIVLNSTPISGGTTGRIIYNNAGTAGELNTTGTGVAVLSSSPSLTTPSLGVATATSVNKVTITQPAASAVLTIANTKTATFSNTMTFAASGDGNTYTFPGASCVVASADIAQILTNKTIDTNANTIQLSGSAFTRGQLPGSTGNTPAAAGYVGELSVANLASGSATALVTTTAKNIVSFTLGAGDWDVTGFIGFLPAAGTSVTQYIASISTTTNTLDVTSPFAFNQQSFAAQIPAGLPTVISCGAVSAILAGNTTYYLVAQSIFTVSTMTAYGSIRARRIH